MKIRATLLLLGLCCPILAEAQLPQFELQPEALPVTIYGWQVYSPWAGGFSESHPAFADIYGTSKLDLFIGHLFDPVVFFRNAGTPTAAQFVWQAGVSDSLISWDGCRGNPDFWDLDGDGDLDCLVGSGHVTFVRNLGTPTQPDLLSPPDSLRDDQGNVVFGTHVALADLDGDGDGDLVCGEYTGYLQLYRNTGTPDSFSFHLESTQWLGLNMGYQGDPDPTFCDIDGDGDLDLFIGNSYGNLWFYRNDGTPQNYNFTYITNNYDSIDVGAYASPEFADIDGDGDYDLFVGREPAGSSLLGDLYFYRNMGTSQAAQFQLVTKDYLTLDISHDVSLPQVVDINADGRPELFLAGPSTLFYFENTGDSLSPHFNLVSEAYQGISRPGIFPCFGDLNADGKLELLAGEAAFPTPTIALYTNRGTPTNPQFVLTYPNYLTNPEFEVCANPGLADIDGDGDLDLFVSDDGGNFYFYQNIGTAQSPTFTPVTNQWQGIHFTYPNDGWRGFCFGDLDHDGDLDLLMSEHHAGQDDGNLMFYRNTGTPQNPIMSLQTHSLLADTVYQACPDLVDIDQDGDLDLFCGEVNGGVMFFRNTTGESGINPKRPQGPPERMITILPNPGNGGTTISYVLDHPQKITLDVFNLLGAKVASLASGLQLPGNYSYTWDASAKASGIYLIRLQRGEEIIARKVMIVK